MDSTFTYTLKMNDYGIRAIHFDIIKDQREFMKHLLQILAMYNFLICSEQDIWSYGEVHVVVTGNNGSITLHINRYNQIALIENEAILGFNKILAILDYFCIFNLREECPQKDVILEYL